MKNKWIKIILYSVSLALSIIVNLEIFNPGIVENALLAATIQFVFIYIFIVFPKKGKIETDEETLIKGRLYIYLIILISSSALGIILAFTSGNSYCRTLKTLADVVWDRSYVAMKLFSVWPFMKIAPYLYLLIYGKFPNIDYDYFNKNK